MPYLGNVPAEAYSQMSYQDLTGGSGTSFTLDYPVGNENEIEVFVNNVRQEPTVAYTTAGTALTMTGTIAATDDFYVVFQGKAQQTIGIPEKQTNGDYSFSNTLLVGKSASDRTVAGGEILSSGGGRFTRDSADPLYLNRLTDDGTLISMRRNDTVVGSIGIQASGFYIDGESGHEGMRFANGAITPRENGGDSDGTSDLGASNNRFKDLYLSGGAYLGGTGSANKLDDYEEGTWLPSFSFTNGNGTSTIGSRAASYVKVGNFVFINGYIVLATKGTASGDCRISAIPFTPRNTTNLYQLVHIGLNNTVSGQDFDGDFDMWGQLDPNDATLRMYALKGAGSLDQLNAVDVQNNTTFRFSCWYAV